MNRIVLYNNYPDTEDENRIREILFEEYGEDSEWGTPDEVDDSLVSEFLQRDWEISWEEFEQKMNAFFQENSAIVVGTVGTWRGALAAGKRVDSLNDLSPIWRDCDYLYIYEEKGRLFFESTHHDGTNYFELKRLTQRGIDYLENSGETKETHQVVFSCNVFSGYPYLSKRKE